MLSDYSKRKLLNKYDSDITDFFINKVKEKYIYLNILDYFDHYTYENKKYIDYREEEKKSELNEASRLISRFQKIALYNINNKNDDSILYNNSYEDFADKVRGDYNVPFSIYVINDRIGMNRRTNIQSRCGDILVGFDMSNFNIGDRFYIENSGLRAKYVYLNKHNINKIITPFPYNNPISSLHNCFNDVTIVFLNPTVSKPIKYYFIMFHDSELRKKIASTREITYDVPSTAKIVYKNINGRFLKIRK